MSIQGQPTYLAERVEIGERWQAGQSDAHIAQALQRPLATVRKWRRRYQRQGRAGLTRPLGRPKVGALGQSSVGVVQAIAEMRQAHPGWGPLTLLTELQHDPRIAAYLKARGWVKQYEHHQELAGPTPQVAQRPHQEWEMDAQGSLPVAGLGSVSLIDIADVFSHVKVESLACLHKTHANTQDHQLALRRAFAHYGLPQQISLDHDSVFYDNQTASPFPTGPHLWLIGLGAQVRFIHQPPPAEHARIERAHQTLTQQALAGQTFQNVANLQEYLSERLHFLNQDYPCRTLQGLPPLMAYPQALHSARPYRLECERDLLDLQRVYAYLAQGRWFRLTSPLGMFSLGAQRYNARMSFAKQTLEITFDPHARELICLPERGASPFRLPVSGLTKEVLMGELDPLLSLPVYQLALPFSPQACRELRLCDQLAGTTL